VSDLRDSLASLKIERDRPARRSWRWPILLLVPAVLVLAALYVMKARQALAIPEVATARADVTSGPASGPTPGAAMLTASGYVVARRKAVVSAKIQGRLAELRVEEGSRVREGELIARLESSDYEAALLRSKAAIVRAEADLEESRRRSGLADRLASEKVLSTDERDAAASRVRVAEAVLEQARADLAFSEAQLQNTRILAPFTGVVVKKMAEVGESVAPIPPGVNLSTSSGAVVALADLDTLEVEADVSESNVAKLGAEQPAEVTVEAFPDRTYRAVLRQVIPTADRTKATVQVKVTILDKDADLKPEMSAKVTFTEKEQAPVEPEAPAPRVVTVPKDAVVERAGKSVAFEVVGDAVRARTLTLGGARGDRVVVKEGLSGGELLVTSPPPTLEDGDEVRK
jgi:RND family efflux transporter MFP subunit